MQQRPALLSSGLWWRAFVALLVVWLTIAVLQPADDAQDVVPFLAAGELVHEEPGQVYVDETMGIYELHPRFREASCPRLEGLNCERHAVAFVSPPGVLPLLVPFAELPNEFVVRVLRLVFAAALAAGMLLLWRRLAHRSSLSPVYLVGSAVALTPFALLPIGLGQSSPLMFLSTVLGVSIASRSRWWAAAVGVLWVGNVLTKALPSLLAIVLLWQRRWGLLLASGGVIASLTLVAVWLGGAALVPDFLQGSRAVHFDSTFSPFSGSIESALRELTGVSDHDRLAAIGMALRFGALAIGCVAVTRARDRDVQWALAWGLAVVLAPLNWWHYAWVLIGVLGVVLWRCDPRGKHLWLLPALACTTIPITLSVNRGWPSPVLQLGWMVGVLVLCLILVRSGADERSRAPARAH